MLTGPCGPQRWSRGQERPVCNSSRFGGAGGVGR